MKRMVLLAGFALLIHTEFQQPFRAPSGSTVDGIVLEAGTDRPLERVQVSLATGSEPTYQFGDLPTSGKGVTDSQGRFIIEAKPGRYRVIPVLEGFVYSRPARLKSAREPGVWVQVSEGQRTQNVRLRMVREGVISGRVLDPNGQPPATTTLTASVTLLHYKYDDYGKRDLGPVPGVSFPGSAFSFVRPDDRGEFRLYGLQPGDYYLSVSGGGGAIGAPATTYYPGSFDKTKAAPIHVAPGEQVNVGTITMQQGQIKGVEVRFRFPDDGSVPALREIRFAEPQMLIRTSGRRGEIVLPKVAPGHYEVVVTASSGFNGQGMLYSRVSLDVGDSDIDQEIVLRPGIHVTGHFIIEDASGQRTNSAGVGCRLRSELALSNCSATITPGFYQLELPADTYLISAKAGGRNMLPDGVQIDTNTEIEVVFGSPGGVLTGVVKDSKDEKISDAVVVLVPDAPMRGAGPLYRTGVSDVNGGFELRKTAPGFISPVCMV